MQWCTLAATACTVTAVANVPWPSQTRRGDRIALRSSNYQLPVRLEAKHMQARSCVDFKESY